MARCRAMALSLSVVSFILLGLARGSVVEVPDELLAWGTEIAQSTAGADVVPACGEVETSRIEELMTKDPHRGFFTYDKQDKRSWSTFANLQQCFEGLTPFDGVNMNMWEYQKLAYRNLSARMDPSLWETQPYIESNVLTVQGTVLTTDPELTAPFSEVGATFQMQQPCSALSNAAFYEIAMDACGGQWSLAVGTWDYSTEFSMAAYGMAFGSFAMHSGPDPTTHKLDVIGMDCLFYVIHQAHTRLMFPATITDWTPFNPILALSGVAPVVPWQLDARDQVRAYVKDILGAPHTDWTAQANLQYATSLSFMTTAGALVMVMMRSIIHPETFGQAAADAIFPVVCNGLVLGTGGDPTQVDALCSLSSGFFTALNHEKFRCAKEIFPSLQKLLGVLGMLIQAMYWQEERAEPTTYKDPYLASGLITPNGPCWKTMHATWHREAAQMIRKLSRYIHEELDTYTMEPPLTQAQKDVAWTDPTSIATWLPDLAHVVTLKTSADEVNMCKVLERAKEGGDRVGGVPYKEPQHPLTKEYLNENLPAQLATLDPLDVGELVSGDFDAAGCDFSYSVSLGRLAGFSCLQFESFTYGTKYEAGIAGSPVLTTWVDFITQCLRLEIEISGTIQRSNCALGSDTKNLNVVALFDFAIEGNVSQTSSIAGLFDTDPAGPNPFTGTLNKLELTCHEVHIDDLSISNFWGDGIVRDALNYNMGPKVLEQLCTTLEAEAQTAVNDALQSLMTQLRDTATIQRRRLTTPTTPTCGVTQPTVCPAPVAVVEEGCRNNLCDWHIALFIAIGAVGLILIGVFVALLNTKRWNDWRKGKRKFWSQEKIKKKKQKHAEDEEIPPDQYGVPAGNAGWQQQPQQYPQPIPQFQQNPYVQGAAPMQQATFQQGPMPPMGQNQMPPMGQNQMPPMGQNQMPPMGQNQMPPMGQNQTPPTVPTSNRNNMIQTGVTGKFANKDKE